MKKVLLIILLGFIVVSILVIMFTVQIIPTFRGFEDDNGDNDDDHFNDLILTPVNFDDLNSIFLR